MTRSRVIRGAYVAAVAAAAVQGWSIGSGRARISIAETSPGFQEASQAAARDGVVFVAILALVFAGLAWRPQWWGKLICLFVGFCWLFFAGFGTLIGAAAGGPVVDVVALWISGVCGAVLWLAALAHQIADPRWTNPTAATAGA